MKKINAVVATALLAVSATAIADPVYDTITVYDASNNVLATVTETQAQANAGDVISLSGIAVDINQFGNYGIVIGVGGTVLDIYGICIACGADAYDLGFQALPTGYPLQNTVNDTGAPLSMTMYLDPVLQRAGDTAFFTATGSVIAPVPEPATLLLVGLGLAGLRLARRTHPPLA